MSTSKAPALPLTRRPSTTVAVPYVSGAPADDAAASYVSSDGTDAGAFRLVLSPRVARALLDRSRSTSAADVSRVLETIVESYLEVVRAHGHEAELDPDHAVLVYNALSTSQRDHVAERDVSALEADLRAYLEPDHEPESGGPPSSRTAWDQRHRELLWQVGEMTAGGEAAVLDRVLLAARGEGGAVPLRDRLRVVGLATGTSRRVR